MNNFVHLHVHSEFSLLDGACRIKKLISKAKELNQSSIAITDHGVMYGAIDFYKEAKKQGVKPIIGCEVYVAPRTRFDKLHGIDSEPRHMVLLCKNNEGYKNLITLVSKGFTEGFYNKPRVDIELLKKYNKGIIALSGCLAGEIAKCLVKNDYSAAKKAAVEYENIFGKDNFYLEIQDHGIKEQKQINPLLIKLSNETKIPLVATNDCHYISKSNSTMHEVLLCIQTNHTINDPNKMEFSSNQFYLKNKDEMEKLFPKCKEAIQNTAIIAEKCNVEFEFHNTKLPHFEVPNKKDHFEFFKEECYKGLYKNYGKIPNKSIIDRLEFELNTIKNMGYVDYYLIVNDFIAYAKSQKIAVGPGRGSGAGSLAAYCMGITGIDPIRYNLLFERFLNPERVSMPDFDVDFCYERRQEVIDYVVRKYGSDYVAQIITFGTMAARGSIRDVGRVLEIPYSTVDSIAKLVPMEIGMTIEKALKTSSELKQQYDTNNDIKNLIDMALKLEGMPRHASTHAAGVVITREPINNYVPLSKNDEAIVTQYTMTTLEELGLLKIDFLGLRNLTVLKDAEKMIQEENPSFKLDDIKEDEKVFDMFSKGETEGVFQFESAGMKNVLSQLKPQNIEDLIAVISLYRPGPMESIPKYIQNRHNPEKITYLHPLLSKILDVTYGCIIYQEQVMQIFRTLAGYSLGRADIVRRAMSKKKVDVMEKEKQIFIYGLLNKDGKVEVDGCIRRGVSETIAKEIFSQMESFASYAFNKSHAAAYAIISYQTAWLKYNYPHKYMAALLTSVLDNTNKITSYISECEHLKIKVLPPHVNESENGFTVSKNNIRFGLLAIKSLGQGVIKELVTERNIGGKFKSFYDFCKRMHNKNINKRAIESLIKCGALDNLDANRHQMLSCMNTIIDDLDNDKRKNLDGQLGFFDIATSSHKQPEPVLPNLQEFDISELLFMEKQIAGIYLSGHPLLKYASQAKQIGATSIGNILEEIKEPNSKYHDLSRVVILAIISSIKLKTTKSLNTMAFATVEDLNGTMEMLVFPQVLNEYSYLLIEGNIVKTHAKISIREDEEPKLICENVEAVSNNVIDNNTVKSKNPGLYIKIENENSYAYERAKLLISIFDGKTPVYFFISSSKKLLLAPKKLWIDINDVLLNELKNQLGESNVALKL